MSFLNKTFTKVLFLGLLPLQPMLALPANSDVTPYNATYKAKYNGIDITATHQLIKKENGLYLELSLIHISEPTRLHSIYDNGL